MEVISAQRTHRHAREILLKSSELCERILILQEAAVRGWVGMDTSGVVFKGCSDGIYDIQHVETEKCFVFLNTVWVTCTCVKTQMKAADEE